MILLDGKKLSAEIKAEIAAEVKQLVASGGKRPPHLAAVLVGNDGASETYIASKVKSCHEVGFISSLMRMESYKIETEGKHCVVLGRSNIVGMPMSILMARNNYPGNCTVTLCHSKTKNVADVLRTADIIIAAIGVPKFVKAEMVKDGAV